MIISVGTPSLLNRSDKPSCACDFNLHGKALAHPQGWLKTCAHLFLLLDLIEANIVSVNNGELMRLYLNCLSLVLNLLDRVGHPTDLTARWVVDLMVC